MPFSVQSSPQRPPKKTFSSRIAIKIFLPIVVFTLLVVSYAFVKKAVTEPVIGVVTIDGIVLESESTVNKLRVLENHPSVVGMVVRINSPGGAVVPSQEIFTELLRLKKKKRIYISIGSVAASGGYYIAIGGNKIFANPGSLTGSIGVIMQSFNVEKLMNKIGVHMEILKAGKNKDLGSAFRPMKPEERKLLEAVLNNTHDQFVQAITENRTLEIKQVKQLADGRLFTGEQALENGLIDGLASFRQTVEILRKDLGIKEPVELLYPNEKQNLLRSVLDLDALFQLKETFTYSGLFYLGSLVY